MTKREFSAGGIVVKRQGRGHKVLLIKDSYGRWTWPKGNIDKGETSKDAALREVTEETGLKNIRIVRKAGQTQYFYKFNGEPIFKTVYIYLMEAQGNEKIVVQKEEIREANWYPPAQALKKLNYKGAAELLQKTLQKYRKLA